LFSERASGNMPTPNWTDNYHGPQVGGLIYHGTSDVPFAGLHNLLYGEDKITVLIKNA